MAATTPEVNNDSFYFGLTLLGLTFYVFVYLCTAFSMGYIRRKIFTKEFMAQFNEEHQEVFGTDAPPLGHPDDGNGYYARKLSYGDWYTLNNWKLLCR